LVGQRMHEGLPFVICMQEAEPDDVEHLSCRICLGLCDRPVTAPCQHNFCLKCFRKWVNQEKTSCPTCRAALGKNLIHNPRINTMLASRIRQAQKVCGFLSATCLGSQTALPEVQNPGSGCQPILQPPYPASLGTLKCLILRCTGMLATKLASKLGGVLDLFGHCPQGLPEQSTTLPAHSHSVTLKYAQSVLPS
jgi:hypothetical protein